jgi:hypothetical protein
VAAPLQADHAVGIGQVALVAGRIEGDPGQRQELGLVFREQLADEPLLAVVLPLVVLGAALKKLCVKGP